MNEFVVHGYIVGGKGLAVLVYTQKYNPKARWVGEVAFINGEGNPTALITNSGHLTSLDAFKWADSERERIEALRRQHYEENKT